MVSYNPNDPVIQKFLDAIALGESGNTSNPVWIGVGGADLSGCSRNVFGFPQWAGYGHPVSHAAGKFQFEPATWNALAKDNHLYFANLADQYKGAWILACQVFARLNNGADLYDAIKRGLYMTIQTSLKTTWTSVTVGNQYHGNLANRLAKAFQ